MGPSMISIVKHLFVHYNQRVALVFVVCWLSGHERASSAFGAPFYSFFFSAAKGRRVICDFSRMIKLPFDTVNDEKMKKMQSSSA